METTSVILMGFAAVVLAVVLVGPLLWMLVRQERRLDRLAEATQAPVSTGTENSRSPGRNLPVVQQRRECGSCEYFDLAAGQALMARQPVFRDLVAPFLAPAQYHELVTEVKPNADGVLENVAEQKSDVPLQCNWSRFGLCTRHNDGLWEQTTAENRLKNMPDLTKDGDCYTPRRAS